MLKQILKQRHEFFRKMCRECTCIDAPTLCFDNGTYWDFADLL